MTDMTRWRDKVIEGILPKEELEALEGWMTGNENGDAPGQSSAQPLGDTHAGNVLHIDVPSARPGAGETQSDQKPVTDSADLNEPADTATGNSDDSAQPEQNKLHAELPTADETEEGRQRIITPGHQVVNDEELAVMVASDDEGSVVETSSDAAPEEQANNETTEESGISDDPAPTGHESSSQHNPSTSDPGSAAEPIIAPIAEAPARPTHSHAPVTESVPLAHPPSAPPPQTERRRSQYATIPGFQPPLPSPGGPGFRRLEVLVLDNNRINTLEAFQVLGALPSLRSLNLSRNRIKSLSFLSAQPSGPADAERSSPAPAANDASSRSGQKFDGFYFLQELDLTFNQIGTPEDLLGIVWLPVLERVALEGNPIMQKGAHKMPVRENGDVLGYIDFDPLVLLPSQYKISITDAIYNTIKTAALPATAFTQRATAGAPAITAPTTVAPHRRHQTTYYTTTAASKFLSHVHRKNAPPTISAGHIVASHTVDDPCDARGFTNAGEKRRTRRAYTFTDEDLKEIVRRGYIPDVEELMQFAEEREREKWGEDNEVDGDDGSDESGSNAGDGARWAHTPEENAGNQLQYDPNARDSTFITGVHITGGLDAAESTPSSPPPQSYISTPPRTPSPFTETPEEDDTTPLPRGLPASLRALRHALSNPLSSWTPIPKAYTHHTVASTRKARLEERGPRGKRLESVPMRKHMLNGGEAMPAWSNHGPAHLPRLKNTHAPAGKPIRINNDEFAQMNQMMRGVNERIQIVEENLASLLDPIRPSPNQKLLLPPSRHLLQRVQEEYTRIEHMYTVAALAERASSGHKHEPDLPTINT
ncbi:hypothetical protein DFJ77DRAFT_237701 [Powellomyces hirtus]|nr:hypothetical protein DFJ77DRAFT_237701 [Powellomyces hirtus]